jgi:hypothetical protein
VFKPFESFSLFEQFGCAALNLDLYDFAGFTR